MCCCRLSRKASPPGPSSLASKDARMSGSIRSAETASAAASALSFRSTCISVSRPASRFSREAFSISQPVPSPLEEASWPITRSCMPEDTKESSLSVRSSAPGTHSSTASCITPSSSSRWSQKKESSSTSFNIRYSFTTFSAAFSFASLGECSVSPR